MCPASPTPDFDPADLTPNVPSNNLNWLKLLRGRVTEAHDVAPTAPPVTSDYRKEQKHLSPFAPLEIVVGYIATELSRGFIVSGSHEGGAVFIDQGGDWCRGAIRGSPDIRLVINSGIETSFQYYHAPEEAARGFIDVVGLEEAREIGLPPDDAFHQFGPSTWEPIPPSPEELILKDRISAALQEGRTLSWFHASSGRPFRITQIILPWNDNIPYYSMSNGWGGLSKSKGAPAPETVAWWFIGTVGYRRASAALEEALRHPIGWRDDRHCRMPFPREPEPEDEE